MINRTYVVMLTSMGRPQLAAQQQVQQQQVNPSSLDIIVGLPGSATAPVAVAASYPGATVTPAPAGWLGGPNGAYYEMRGRSLPFEKFSGQTGFVPRTRLGIRLSIMALQNVNSSGDCSNLLPMLGLSASLAPAPGVGAPLVFGTNYAAALADPNYGPVIRVYDTADLAPDFGADPALYLVSLGIAEAKDEDFTAFGRG